MHISTCHQKSGKPKITNLCVHLGIEEDVAHLQISVDNAFAVHVLNRTSDLDRVETDLGLGETFPSLHHIHQGTIGTQFENQVGAPFERKGSQELDNILVLHLGVNLELGLELDELDMSHVPSFL